MEWLEDIDFEDNMEWSEDIDFDFLDDADNMITKSPYGNNEVSLTLLGWRIGRLWLAKGHWGTEGTSVQVNIDPTKVLDREEEKGDVIGFWHTHPSFVASPSGRDYLTMRGWWISFGKPIVCCIHGIDGLKAHWFFDDESNHVTGFVRRFGDWFIGIVPSKNHE
jgi:proteasome lid subunit RPN8/RPN11